MNSPHACPVIASGALGRFITDYTYYLAFPAIIIGLYLFAVGGKYPEFTLALFSTLAITLSLLTVLYVAVLPYQCPSWTVWIVGFVCLGLGAGMGYGAAKWPKIGIAIMGASLGSLIGYGLYTLIMKNSEDLSGGNVGTKLAMIGSIGLFTLAFSVYLFEYAIITTSAIFGSYILIRVSLIFPSMLSLIKF